MKEGHETRSKVIEVRCYHILWRFLDLVHVHGEQEQSHNSEEQESNRDDETALCVHFVSEACGLMRT